MVQNRSGLRIIFSGAQSTGKTTIATRLAEELQLPLITEGAREIIKRRRDRKEEFPGCHTQNRLNTPWETLETQKEIYKHIRDQYDMSEAQNGFVADRCMIDVLAYSYLGLSDLEEAEDFIEIIKNQVFSQSNFFDAIFISPPCLPPEEDGLRNTNKYKQEMINHLVSGIAEEYEYPTYYLYGYDLEKKLRDVRNVIGCLR